jgi:hypothetical protein
MIRLKLQWIYSKVNLLEDILEELERSIMEDKQDIAQKSELLR